MSHNEVGNENNSNKKVDNYNLAKPSVVKPIALGVGLSFIPLIIIPFLNLLASDTFTFKMLLSFLTEIFCKFEIIFIGVSRASAMLSERTNNKKQNSLQAALTILAVFGTATYTGILIKGISSTNNMLWFNIVYIVAVILIEYLLKKSLSKKRGE